MELGTQFYLTNVSIVVVAEHHNPTILNPDFLKAAEIVPPDWEVAPDPITTPAMSLVRFTNGIVITVDQSRLHVGDNNRQEGPGDSPVAAIARKYVQKLPHVRFKSVGINFQGMIRRSKPRDFLLQRFMTKTKWTSKADPVRKCAIKLEYDGKPGRATIELEASQVKPREQESKPKPDKYDVLLVRSNFHRDIISDDYPCDKHVRDMIGKHFDEDWHRFKKLGERLLGVDFGNGFDKK